MARTINRLKPAEIKNAKPKPRKDPADGTLVARMLNDGGGLYLRAAPGTNKTVLRTWIFRYTLAGKDHQLSLGPYPEVSIDEARDKAAEQRKLCRARVDPITKRKQDKNAVAVADQAEKAAATPMTFRNCAQEYLDLNAGWSQSYRDQWNDLLKRFVYPILGNEPVADIDRTPIKAGHPRHRAETHDRAQGAGPDRGRPELRR
jgi:hypothetical protein